MELQVTFKTPLCNVQIGDGLPTHLIAEIGLNHNGSLDLARQMVLQAALSGATFVKFQKRTPEILASSEFLDSSFSKCPSLGSTQREVRKRLELTLEAYKELKEYAEQLGLIFFASAFDLPSLDFLMELGTPLIKVASHSITNATLLKKIAEYKIPTICSFGGTTEKEKDQAFDILQSNPMVILHCVSSYPTPDSLVKIDTIAYLKEKYQVPVGFSSHENGIDISVAASVLGACMIERHFTLNRAMIGLDQGISLTPEEFSEMALKIRRISNCRGVKKGLMDEEKKAKYDYHVGVYATQDIPAGKIIQEDDICCKQPLKDPELFFTGFEFSQVIGMRTQEHIAKDKLISKLAVKK